MAKDFSISALCRVFGVSRSGFYGHRKKQLRLRRQQDQQLRPMVKQAFEQSRQSYGSPRITAQLASQGVRCGKNRVARLMREQGIRPRQKRKFRPPAAARSTPAPNWPLLVPAPDRPNQIWTSDITYIWTWEGWLYLAGHMDLFSRKIVGWAVSDSLETSLVLASLAMACSRRRPGRGLIHHSDQGCQYTSTELGQRLKDMRISPSMSRRGNCYDNAAQESFWATLKTECFGEEIPRTRKEAELRIFSYIEGFYNSRRRHSALGYRSPEEFELDSMRSQSLSHATASCGEAEAA